MKNIEKSHEALNYNITFFAIARARTDKCLIPFSGLSYAYYYQVVAGRHFAPPPPAHRIQPLVLIPVLSLTPLFQLHFLYLYFLLYTLLVYSIFLDMNSMHHLKYDYQLLNDVAIIFHLYYLKS